MNSRMLVPGLCIGVLLVSSCSGPERYPGIPTEQSSVRTPTGLRYIDIVAGSGVSPERGSVVTVHYTGFLLDSTKFDSSVDRGEPFEFTIGIGQVIGGWDEGVLGMKAGGKRKLIIPAHLAYKERGVPGVIPPDAELVFDVELLQVKKP